MSRSVTILALICVMALTLGEACLAAGCSSCGKKQKPLIPGPLCGPLAARAMLEHFGVKADFNEIKKLCGYDEKNGTTLEGLCAAFAAKGLHARAVKISSDELLASGLPFVAHYYYDHLIAVEPTADHQFKITYDEKGETGLFSKEKFPKKQFDEVYSGFAVLVSDDASKFPVSNSDGPDLRVYDHVWEFGAVKSGEVSQHVFKLRNLGSKNLAISKIKTSCDCLTASVSKSTLQPGQETDLLVIFNGSDDASQQNQIVIESNDPVVPTTTLLAQGFVKPGMLLPSPSYVDFGQPVRRGKAAQCILFVPQYPDNSIQITGITPDKYVETAIEKVSDKDHTGYNVTFALRPETPMGRLERKLVIGTTHYAQKDVEVVVRANVVGGITLHPEQLFIVASKNSTKRKGTITVSTSGKDVLKIDKIDCPLSYVSVDVAPKTEGKEYVLTASLKPDAPVGNIKGEVTIHTNDPDQPEIKVPVYAYMEEK